MQGARKLGLKKVGEVAEMFDTTPRTLLYYEEEGIISPRRTARGTRVYTESDIKRFEIAYRMSSLGIPLRTVKEFAQTRPAAATGDESGRKLCLIIDLLKDDLTRQIRHIESLKQDMDRAQLMIRQCWGCENKPSRTTCPNCPCEVYIDQAQTLWLTWDADRGDVELDLAELADDTARPQGAEVAPTPARRAGKNSTRRSQLERKKRSS